MTDRERHSWVGRTLELERLRGALALAAGGSPQVVLILGPGGVGKSALLTRFAADAEVPLRIGACLPLGSGDVPFLPFIELLRGMVESMPPEELLPILGRARMEVARLLPELGPAAHHEEDPGLARAMLFEQLRGVAERLGGGVPRILAIEDLQWADPSTRDLVLFLARNVRHARLLLVLTCRTDELPPGHAFTVFAAELERSANVSRMELTGLDRLEVATLAAAVLERPAPDRLVERLLERTGGNPLFLEELLATAGTTGDTGELAMPPRLRDALVSRLAGRSADARRLAGLAAVAGRHSDTRALEALFGGAGERLDAALRETFDGGLLTPDPDVPGGDAVRFRHPLLREVAEADLLPGERARAHAAMAERLARPDAGPELLAEMAGHWIAAGDDRRALAASVAAGMAASAAVAPAEALRHLDRALERFDGVPDAAAVAGMDRIALLERIADAAGRAGAYDRSIAAIREGLRAVDPVADAARAADLRRSLRWALWNAGDVPGALVEAESAVTLLSPGGISAVRANALAHLAGLRLVAGDAPGAAGIARAALVESEATGAASEAALAVGVLGLAELRLGDPDAGLAHVRAAWERALAMGHVSGVALAYDQLAGALAGLGRTSEAADLALEGIAEAARLGLDRTFGVRLRASAAEALLTLGRWPEAERLVAEGLAGEPSGHEGVAIHVAAARGAVRRGEAPVAARHLTRAAGLAGRPPAPLTGPAWAGTLGSVELALMAGRAAEARAIVADALADPRGLPPGDRATLVRAGLRAEAELAVVARVHADPAGVAEARARATALLILARRRWPGTQAAVGRATRLAAAAEAARTDRRVAPERWERLCAAWQEADRPIDAADAALRGAEARLAGGDRAAAARLVTQGLRLAEPAGPSPLVESLRDLARRARLTLAPSLDPAAPGPTGLAGPGPSGLTPRELEVLALMAEGRTNRQIGETLYISPKTVSVHVTNVLGKLGVSSRVEAATMALRLGLVRTR